MGRKIQVVLVLFLSVGLLSMLLHWNQGEKERTRNLKNLGETYSEYDKRIKSIRNSMEKKKREIENVEQEAHVILAFSEENGQLMEEVFPMLEERGIQATLVLKNGAEHNKEALAELNEWGWDIAFGGEIGKEKERYIENLKSAVKAYEGSTGKAVNAYFFNGKEYGTGSRLLYPEFEDLSFEISVAFSKNDNILNHGINRDYGREIEECQNISMREDFRRMERILEQTIEKKSVVVLSDFGSENQMEIAEEAPLDQLEQILDMIEEKQAEEKLIAGSVSQYLEAMEDRKKTREERQMEYQEYEKQCQEEIKKLTKEREAFLEK